MTSYRKLNENDDISRIAEGIYYTDIDLFNLLFNNKKTSIQAICNLINSNEINQFHRDFITVCYDENPNEVIGFAVTYKGSNLSRTSSIKAFLDDTVRSIGSFLLLHAVDAIFNLKFDVSDYFIGNLFIFEEYRNRGHGTNLVEYCLNLARKAKSNNIFVDVNFHNVPVEPFYEDLGFKENSYNKHIIFGKKYGYYEFKYNLG